MKVTVIYAHPNPKSYNKAILDTALEALKARGAEFRVIDLYGENPKIALDGEDFGNIFSGRMPADVVKYQEDIAWADRLLFVFPVWWWSFPAILKGFIDRVFVHGFAYRIDEKGIHGLLGHEKALVFMTTGGPEEQYRAGNAVELLTRPISQGVMGFCGVPKTDTRVFYGLPATPEQRAKWLEEVKEAVAAL